MSCDCDNNNVIFGKTSVNVRCMDKGVYTGKYFGLHTTEENCCGDSEEPVYVAPNKGSANNFIRVGKTSEWDCVADTTYPIVNQIIIYTDDNYVFSGMKIGNGTSSLADLPFAKFN